MASDEKLSRLDRLAICEARDMLTDAATGERRLELIRKLTEGFCLSCGRVLAEGERCSCNNDD